MTQTTLSPAPGAGTDPTAPPATGAPARPPRGRRRRAACFVAIAACLPYITLKVLWIGGSELGIPAGSSLLEPDNVTPMRAANALTVLMDAAVIGLALLLTLPSGRRAPAWVPVLPAWLATGLLGPIMVAFPVQLLTGTGGEKSAEEREFLAEWVFSVVYGGFIVQGLALGALFVWYARDRWGGLWRGRTGDLPAGATGAARKATAVAAVLLAVPPLTTHLLWAAGSTAGLHEGSAGSQDDSALFARSAAYVLFLLAGATGLLLLAFHRRRPGRGVRLAVPFGLTWAGSGALACWGGWMLLGALAADPADGPTPLVSLTYAVQMTVGVVIVTAGAHFLAERSTAGTSARAATTGTPAGRRTE